MKILKQNIKLTNSFRLKFEDGELVNVIAAYKDFSKWSPMSLKWFRMKYSRPNNIGSQNTKVELCKLVLFYLGKKLTIWV